MEGQDRNARVLALKDGWQVDLDFPAGSALAEPKTLTGTRQLRISAFVPAGGLDVVERALAQAVEEIRRRRPRKTWWGRLAFWQEG